MHPVMASPPARRVKASGSGVDPAGVGEASKLLRSVRSATEKLVQEMESWEGSRRKWMPKVAAELQELRKSMSPIRNVLLDADPQQRIPDAMALARQARDAIFVLEELRDMVEYRRLEFQRTRRRPSDSESKLGRMISLLFAAKHLMISCDGLPSCKLLKGPRLVIQETRKLVRHLAKTTATGPSSSTPQLLDYPNNSGSGANSSMVIGRDADRDEILRMLTEPCGRSGPTVISIVGLGGVGKTTLAQVAYNDAIIQQHFDIKSWVFVSTGSDRLEVATEILRSAHPSWVGSGDKMVDFDVVQSELRRVVQSKRCLIVLDDVWDEATLQDILTPLQSAGTGSRILLTSRSNMLGGASQVYPLDPLGIDDCWALIKEQAFRTDQEDQYPDLQIIGRKIAAKIYGSPLAAKIVGKLLGATRIKEQWKNIMDKLVQDDDAVFSSLHKNITGASIQDDSAVLPALRLSYNLLPGHLKQCFAYCSLFPKNWNFDPEHLVKLWIAEGFVQPRCTADDSMEARATEYFDQLLNCSLFHKLELGSKVYYMVHDLLHDLAESVAAGDFLRIDKVPNWDIPLTVRHLSVAMNNLQGPVNFCNLKNLRTLLVLKSLPFSSNWFEKDVLEKSRNLRVLDLSGCNLPEMPQSVGNLLHLRYLSVRGTIQRLPDSIGKLLHLQYLCLPENSPLEKLPAAINKLVNLRDLGIAEKHTAALVGIRYLVNLQGSLEFHIDKLEGRSLEELRNINGLRGLLKIRGLENVSSKGEACTAELNKKRNLHSLSLEWSSAHRKLHPPSDAEVLEGLLPHQDLNELCIRRYCGTEAPSWLHLPLLQHLQSLRLINCRGLAFLPPLGHLRLLRTLHMRELCAVDQIGDEFYGNDHVAFPSLCFLEFDDFPKLREWHGIPNRKSFPCLERLKLIDCPKLTQIPSLPPTTTEVTIERTELLLYMRLFPSSSSLELLQLDIRTSSVLPKDLLHEDHIRSITTLNISGAEQLVATKELGSLVSLQRLQLSQCGFTDQTFSEFLQALPCVSSLEIIDLHKITSLPVLEKHQSCTMLKDLRIRNCHLLRSLSSLQFFDSLRCLVLERCPELTATSFPVNFANLSSLKVLRISYCPELQYLPVSSLQSSLETLHLVGCHPELSRKIKTHERPLRSFALYPKSLV